MKKTIAGIAITLSLIGCGGGDNSVATNDDVNSYENSEGKTSLGYYGSGVYIGNHVGHKYWSIEADGKEGQVILEMPDHGNELTYLDTTSGYNEIDTMDYGVSANGLTINFDDDFDGQTDLRLTIYNVINSQTYEAYLANVHTNDGLNVILMTTTD
jgi:hypothetical protein